MLPALDYLRGAGVKPDARVNEAVATVLGRRQECGRWLLDVRHRNTLHEELAGTLGAPNRASRCALAECWTGAHLGTRILGPEHAGPDSASQ